MRHIVLLLIFCLLGSVCADGRRQSRNTRRTPVRTEQKSTRSSKSASRSEKPRRTAGSVKSERRRTQQEIAETRNRIDRTRKETRRSLEELEGINAGIRRQENNISVLSTRVDSVSRAIKSVGDSIGVLEGQVTAMRADVKESLRAMRQRRRQVNDMAFIFSAPGFDAARRRISYLDQLNKWRAHKIAALCHRTTQLQERRKELSDLKGRQASTLSQLNASRRTLIQQKEQQQKVVTELRGQEQNLNNILKEKQKRMRDLDNELDRIIAEEVRRREARERAAAKARAEAQARENARAKERAKAEADARHRAAAGGKETARASEKSAEPANSTSSSSSSSATVAAANAGIAAEDRRLSGSFASNKGHLLFPVSGKYTIVGSFGRNGHADLSNVQVNNSGIDIAVSPGSHARAVFDGTVSSVFFMNGYNNIVILRHGQYLTVYAGLTGLNVHKGQSVKAGTSLGNIQADSDNPGRSVLHFEVRRERQKLNPLDWVR